MLAHFPLSLVALLFLIQHLVLGVGLPSHLLFVLSGLILPTLVSQPVWGS